MVLIKLAWRNLWRNHKRTLITSGAISFGGIVLIFSFAFFKGMHIQMLDTATKTYIGHVQIHQKGMHKKFNIEKIINEPELIEDVLKKEPLVYNYSKRLRMPALISCEMNSSGAMILGIDPVAEQKITNLKTKIEAGSFLSEKPNENEIIIGKSLASRLKAEIGSEIILITQGVDGSTGNELFKVKGIIAVGDPKFDDNFAFINIQEAYTLLSLENQIHDFVLVTKDPKYVNEMREIIKSKLNNSELEVLSWDEIAPGVKAFIAIDDAYVYLLMIIVVFIIGLGIVNTMMMSIFERTREIGTMMALGTSENKIFGIITLEIVLIGVVGTFIGCVIGIPFTQYFAERGVSLSADGGSFSMGGMSFESMIYPVLSLGSLIIPSIAIAITTVVASVFPILRISKLKPVEAIYRPN